MPDDDLLLVPPSATPAAALVTDPIERSGLAPLSFAQQRLWFLTQIEGVSQAYHIPFALDLDGPLDRVALGQALDAVVARHEALRTRFVTIDGEAFAHIDRPDIGFPLLLADLTGEPAADEAFRVLQQEEITARFDLAEGRPARARLVTLGPRRHVLLVTLHHIAADGWSVAVLTRELSALYAGFSRGEPDPLPPLPMQYADYARWQREWSTAPAATRQRDYWLHTLADAPVLDLPTDRPRPPEPDFAGGQLLLEFDAALTADLKALSQRHGGTLFMTVLAGWAVVLTRLSGQEDLVIGTPTANRPLLDHEDLIGFFVNTLALRFDLSGEPTVAELLDQVRDVVLTGLDHQDLPFEQVVEVVNPVRSVAHTPLFQTVFGWQTDEGGHLTLPEVRVTSVASPYTAAKFELALSLAESGGRLTGGFDYATALFDAPTIERFGRYLRRVLAAMLDDPAQLVSALPLIDDTERRDALAASAQITPHPVTDTIQELFEAQVVRAPDAVAVTADGSTLTYRELNDRANRLANHLREQGIGPDTLVAVCLDRSPELIVALLAILKAGGAYVPLDPAQPVQRLAWLLADARPPMLLVHASTRARLSEAISSLTAVPRVVDLDADQAAWANTGWAEKPEHDLDVDGLTPQRLAYVIYTSGSTGTPKGVMVEHANVVRLFAATARWSRFGPDDVWVLFHSVAFDFSVWEVWGALLHGGRLVIVPALTSRNPTEVYQLLVTERVTVLNQTPSAFRGLIAAQADRAQQDGIDEHRLRMVIFGGEALDPAMLARWCDDPRNRHTDLVNMYGITETTVHVTHWRITPDDLERPGASPIGYPIDDLRVYLLDPHGAPVPLGVVGEVHVGGAGVARGYLNQPDLTAERFLTSPFVAGDRLYRTGDLARQRADGSLTYIGRNDAQVKVRGFRVELGEIEARLRACPGVGDAVVIADRDAHGETRLVGYVIAAPDAPPLAAGALRAALAAELPDHMVPAAYVQVEAWPLTSNGSSTAVPCPRRMTRR